MRPGGLRWVKGDGAAGTKPLSGLCHLADSQHPSSQNQIACSNNICLNQEIKVDQPLVAFSALSVGLYILKIARAGTVFKERSEPLIELK
jgi:hypothetical protein